MVPRAGPRAARLPAVRIWWRRPSAATPRPLPPRRRPSTTTRRSCSPPSSPGACSCPRRSPRPGGARRRWTRADRLLVVCALVVVVFFSHLAVEAAGLRAGRRDRSRRAVRAALRRRAAGSRGDGGARIVRRGSLILAVVCLGLRARRCSRTVQRPGRVQTTFRIRSAEFDRLQPAVVPLTVTLSSGWRRSALAALAGEAPARSRLAVFAAFPLSLVIARPRGPARSTPRSQSSRPAGPAVREAGPRVASADPSLPDYFPTGLPFYLRRPVVLISRDGREMTSNYLLFTLREGQSPARGPGPVRASARHGSTRCGARFICWRAGAGARSWSGSPRRAGGERAGDSPATSGALAARAPAALRRGRDVRRLRNRGVLPGAGGGAGAGADRPPWSRPWPTAVRSRRHRALRRRALRRDAAGHPRPCGRAAAVPRPGHRGRRGLQRRDRQQRTAQAAGSRERGRPVERRHRRRRAARTSTSSWARSSSRS